MTIKEKIVLDIEEMENPSLLNQIQEFITLIKRSVPKHNKNIEEVLSFSGVISDAEALELHNIIDQEFNKIEGD